MDLIENDDGEGSAKVMHELDMRFLRSLGATDFFIGGFQFQVSSLWE